MDINERIARLEGMASQIKCSPIGESILSKEAYEKTELCTCYVQHLPIKDQFCLRWGAHSLDCPTYRKSGDHCDNLDDIATRNHHEGNV